MQQEVERDMQAHIARCPPARPYQRNIYTEFHDFKQVAELVQLLHTRLQTISLPAATA